MPQLNSFWSEPSGSERLRKNEIHVWLVRADDGSYCIHCGHDLLSLNEQERAARFKFEDDRRRYIVAHGALRLLLSQYANVFANDLNFFTNANGKPFLVAAPVVANIQFNLSHSHEVALIAVTQGREVGVDVERVKEDFAFGEVAGRFFTAREVAALNALPSELQRKTFYKCWTSKEAFLKAKGTGLSGQLDEVEISFTAEKGVRVSATVANWTLVGLNPPDGYEGALVVEGAECQFRCFQWRPPLMNPSTHRHF
jgi:4'-phosphopantetheinyl transferase